MNSLWLILPLLVPLATAIAAWLCWRSTRIQRWLSVGGAAALLAASLVLFIQIQVNGPQSMQMGSWPAPFGITVVADVLSSMLVVLTGMIGLAVAVYSLHDVGPAREAFGYYPLLHILLLGVVGAFLTGDLFNLYVWFEVMLIASFVLLALGGTRAQLEGAVKYVTMNLVASALLLSGIALLYGMTGTLNLADLAVKVRALPHSRLLDAVAVLLLTAFGIKAAIFPLYFWLPASYHTPPSAVSALFAGLLTKVGAYAAIRMFTLVFVHPGGFIPTVILVAAGFTMAAGALSAMAERECRRLLSFLVISEMGFIFMGLGVFTKEGLAGTAFFLPHVMLSECAVFMAVGAVGKVGGSTQLDRLGGLSITYPALATVFLLPALSLAGMPPFSGMFAKLAVLEPAMSAGHYLIAAVALLASLLTLYAMTRMWNQAFWGPRGDSSAPVPIAMSVATWAVTAGSLMLALGAGPLYVVSLSAADQLLDPALYIAAVLGGTR